MTEPLLGTIYSSMYLFNQKYDSHTIYGFTESHIREVNVGLANNLVSNRRQNDILAKDDSVRRFLFDQE